MTTSVAPDATRTAPAARPAPRRRILALIDSTTVSGPGRQLAAVAVALRSRGVDLRIVLMRRRGRPRPEFAAFLERLGVEHVVLEERGPFDLRLLSAVRREVDTWGADVVETHGYKPTAIAYLLRRAGARWRWLAFFHGATTENLKVRLFHRLDAWMLPTADRVLVMTRAHLGRFPRAAGRVQVLYNSVTEIRGGNDAPDLGALREHGTPLVGVVGRLSSEKGVDVFLHACAALAARGVAFSAVLVGDGPDRAPLEAQRDALGLGGRVHFLGQIAAVHAVYDQLDLLVIPSRSEGLPNVLLEALHHDVPVVSTRVGAVPEVLEDTPGSGRIVPPEQPDALADAMGAALAEGRQPAGTAARAEAAARFSVDRRASALLPLYAAVLGEPS